MRILNERRAAAEGSYLLMKKTNKCMKMGLLAAALLAGVMMGCSNVSNSGSGDSSGSGNGGQGGEQTQKVDFDTWLLKVAFDKDNVPTYTFFKPDDGRKWELDTDVYTVNGKEGEVTTDSVIGPIDFTEVVWHQYRGDNPLYDEDSVYGAMADQFYYYRFTGTVPIVGGMDQYLIAVDKVSSFIFAFAKVTDHKKEEITGQLIPTAYEAIGKSTDDRFFYMNDPIGYVNADGSVLLYDEYTSEMKEKGIDYVPSIHNPDRAEATATAAGRSPYYNK